MLGVAANTLRNWERAEKIAVYRHPINGYRLYKESEILRVLAAIEAPEKPTTIDTHS